MSEIIPFASVCSKEKPMSKSMWRFFSYLLPVLFIATACAQIKVQPKDPQLENLQAFANQVTNHLFDTSPATYEKFQSMLNDEMSPIVLNQLKTEKIAPDTTALANSNTKAKGTCSVTIASTFFPTRANKDNLVPVEVKGKVIRTTDSQASAKPFDIVYWIGLSVKTKQPMVAALQIK